MAQPPLQFIGQLIKCFQRRNRGAQLVGGIGDKAAQGVTLAGQLAKLDCNREAMALN